jgi:hypothetical protein
MADLVAKCPRCKTETSVNKVYKTYHYAVEGTYPICETHFTTSMLWEVLKGLNKAEKTVIRTFES